MSGFAVTLLSFSMLLRLQSDVYEHHLFTVSFFFYSCVNDTLFFFLELSWASLALPRILICLFLLYSISHFVFTVPACLN